MQPRQAMEHSAQRKLNRLVQMRIYCKAACCKARCRRCHAERIARLKRMRQKRDERNYRRTERHVQPREMPGNKADGAVMVLQTRRTRHRRQSNDCRAWRGQSECGASIAAKRRPAFSADSKHSIPTQHCTAMSAHRMPLRHFGFPVQHLHLPSSSSAWFMGGETPPCELRALPSPFTFTPPSVRG